MQGDDALAVGQVEPIDLPAVVEPHNFKLVFDRRRRLFVHHCPQEGESGGSLLAGYGLSPARHFSHRHGTGVSAVIVYNREPVVRAARIQYLANHARPPRFVSR